jgi:glycerol-3-phosphate acyltransferase PlsY
MTEAKPEYKLQFSLRALLTVTTVTCIVLALPSGYLLLAVGVIWMMLGVAISMVLLRFRAPIYRILSGAKLKEKDK